jgi:RNA polymerase sigma-70 factor (ECF subfamily)
LNRAIAQHQGPKCGLEEIRGIAGADRLVQYPFYHAALGELELRAGRHHIARDHFLAAAACGRNPIERHFLEKRVEACVEHSRQRA